ncbi:MAG: hypothetical protein LBS19_04515 [Clostridiales bacterium]|nr:hypothetical protein [Clostridiales bacterium]
MYGIFNALDIRKYTSSPNTIVKDIIAARKNTSAITAAATAAAIDAAANATLNTVTYAILDDILVETAIFAAENTCLAAAAATTYAASRTITSISLNTFFSSESFIELLVEDLEGIRNTETYTPLFDERLYGRAWDNFIDDLNAVGCGYWARLYENIFTNNFKVDQSELERRLFSVPDEIKEKGAAEVGRYLERLGDDFERLNEARIIILGEAGAGKTSLARRLVDINEPMPDPKKDSTEGVDVSLWRLPDENGDGGTNVHIWDFAGQTITHSAHRCFMSARCLYIYVYDGRKDTNNDPRYWLEQIRIHGGESPEILFLINEKTEYRTEIEKKTLKEEYPSIIDYRHVNIGDEEDKTDLKNFRQTVMDRVRNNPSWNRQAISKEAYKIKNELRTLFSEANPPAHITLDYFKVIAQKNDVAPERIKVILKDLHDLGICLWYGEEDIDEFDALVLNPEWITNGIYRIIRKGHNDGVHRLDADTGVRMLEGDKRFSYPREMVAFLFKIMKIYELAFFEDSGDIFVPGILKSDKPDNLPVFDFDKSLTMNFVVKRALPPNIAARVMVNRYKDIYDEDLLWRKGAALRFKDGNAEALIKEDGLSIAVDVTGEDRTAYISSLRETLKRIFEDYKGINPELKYKVLMPEEMERELRGAYVLPENTIASQISENLGILQPDIRKLIDLFPTGAAYNILVVQGDMNNFGPVTNSEIYSKVINSRIKSTEIALHNCSINLQGDLNSLADGLRNKGFGEDADFLSEIASAVEETEKMNNEVPAEEIGDELEKKGLFSKFKEFVNDFSDENSELYKKTVKLRNGVEKAKKIAKVYNEFAKLIPGSPKIPFV